MKLYGHHDVRILDCSRGNWLAEGRPRSTAVSEQADGGYHLGDEDPRIWGDQAAVLETIGQPGAVPVDVRSAAEYRGECFWPSGGMEPGGRAATAWFVLTYLLGREHVRVYEGSWAEWPQSRPPRRLPVTDYRSCHSMSFVAERVPQPTCAPHGGQMSQAYPEGGLA